MRVAARRPRYKGKAYTPADGATQKETKEGLAAVDDALRYTLAMHGL